MLVALSLFGGLVSSVGSIIGTYGYLAIVVLMALESASLPIASEVILPVVGHYVYTGALNFYLALVASLIGTAIGIFVDYYIAYFLGKDVIYKHLSFFHIKRRTLDAFDGWFARNGAMTVFTARLLPVLRGLISFPAGFALMDKKKFFAYSMLGALVWDTALILFGEAASTATSAYTLSFYVAMFAVALYIVYYVIMVRVRRK